LQETAEPVIPDADSLGSLADFWWADTLAFLLSTVLVIESLDRWMELTKLLKQNPQSGLAAFGILLNILRCAVAVQYSGSSIQWQL